MYCGGGGGGAHMGGGAILSAELTDQKYCDALKSSKGGEYYLISGETPNKKIQHENHIYFKKLLLHSVIVEVGGMEDFDDGLF